MVATPPPPSQQAEWFEETRFGVASWQERGIVALLTLAGLVPLLLIGGIFAVFVYGSWQFFQQISPAHFFTATQWTPLFSSQQFGIVVLISATLTVSAIAMMVAMPVGLLAAIYLSEYAPPALRRIIKPVLESLSGVPTIVYGYFTIFYVTPALQQWIPGLSTFNGLSAGLMTGVLIVPVVASLSEDALRSVRSRHRQAAYGCGFTRQEMIVHILLPAAFPGIVASFTLAASRALGETMIAAIAAGQNPRLTLNPLVPIETMTGFIIQVSLGDVPTNSLIFYTIFAVGMVLFLITLSLNTLGHELVRRYHQAMERQTIPIAEAAKSTQAELRLLGTVMQSWSLFRDRLWFRQWGDRLFHGLGLGAALLGPAFLIVLTAITFHRGYAQLSWHFFTHFTSRNPEQAGILAALAGTLWLLGLTTLFAVPIGIAAAIYLEEYVPCGFWSRLFEVNLANAAAVPGILYGLLGLGVLARGMGWLTGGRSLLSAALMMTMLVLPLLITASRSALRQVPSSLKRAGYAVGMSRWQVVWNIVLPESRATLLTGVLMALSRILGETSPLIAIGAVEYITFTPDLSADGLRRPFTTLTTQIFFWLSRPQAAFQAKASATVLVLIALLLIMNVAAGFLRHRLQKRVEQ